ncbi:MAG: PilN domain-containing protein, partial [Pseudomonadota bacterium]
PGARRGARDLAVDWLEALAVALPPRTVVRRLTVDGSRIRIEGAAANAAAALAALEVSEAFTAPRLAAAPARLARNGGAETFVIEASLARVFDDPGPAAPSDERRSSEEPARASGGSQGDGA